MAQSQFVSLAKAWKNPELYGDISKCFVDYRPTSELIVLDPIPEVALTEEQVFETKNPGMGWQPWVRYTKSGELYKIYFVATETMKTICFGRNASGWQKVLENSRCIAEAFENEKLRTKGIPLTFGLRQAMPSHIKARTDDCWILKNQTGKVKDNTDLFFIRNDSIETMATYYSYDGMCTAWREFLPIVEVPSNIMVKVGSKVRNGKKIETSLRIALPSAL